MNIDRCIFFRGNQGFEVLVSQYWSIDLLKIQKQKYPSYIPLFLEKDDLSCGNEAFSLDFLLMKQTGVMQEGEDFLKNIQIISTDLRNHLESEIRRLSAHVRKEFFFKRHIPVSLLETTLSGIQTGVEYLGYINIISDTEQRGYIQRSFFKKTYSSSHLLKTLEAWERFLENHSSEQ